MPGQRIKGVVSYALEKPFQADKLTIELTGKEQLIFDGYDDKHIDSKHPGKVCMKHTTLRLTQVLHSFENGVVVTGKQ